MTDLCNCIVCRMAALIGKSGEIELDTPLPSADLYLMIQTVTFFAMMRGMSHDNFKTVMNQSWEKSEAIIASYDKRKMN